MDIAYLKSNGKLAFHAVWPFNFALLVAYKIKVNFTLDVPTISTTNFNHKLNNT